MDNQKIYYQLPLPEVIEKPNGKKYLEGRFYWMEATFPNTSPCEEEWGWEILDSVSFDYSLIHPFWSKTGLTRDLPKDK